MPEGANAATELRHEHGGIEAMTERIASLGPGPERTELVRKVAARFVVHVRAEERYLYAALRRYLPQGEAEAVEQERQGTAALRIVDTIEHTDATEETFEALANQLVIDIERHIERQDTVLLPTLIDACPLEDINELGRQLRGGFREAPGGDEAGPGTRMDRQDPGSRV